MPFWSVQTYPSIFITLYMPYKGSIGCWAWNHYALLSSSPTCVSGLLYWTERDVHIVSPDIGWGHLTKVKVTSSPTWHLPIYYIYFLLKEFAICQKSILWKKKVELCKLRYIKMYNYCKCYRKKSDLYYHACTCIFLVCPRDLTQILLTLTLHLWLMRSTWHSGLPQFKELVRHPIRVCKNWY